MPVYKRFALVDDGINERGWGPASRGMEALGVPEPLDAIDDRGGRVARFNLNANHRATARFDDVATDDGIFGPVGAFHEHVGLQRGNDVVGRVLIEGDDRIDGRQRLEQLDALVLRRNGTASTFISRHRSIGIDADDQCVTHRPCLLQIANVPRMQQIEHAVGEDDAATGGAKPSDQGHGVRARHCVASFAGLNLTPDENAHRWCGR